MKTTTKTEFTGANRTEIQALAPRFNAWARDNSFLVDQATGEKLYVGDKLVVSEDGTTTIERMGPAICYFGFGRPE